jgi:hypothetical protein
MNSREVAMKRIAAIGILLLGSVGTSAALRDTDKLKEALPDVPLPALTVPCGIFVSELSPPYLAVDKSLCDLTLKVIVTDFDERGYQGRYYCPPFEIKSGSDFFFDFTMRQAIMYYVAVERPAWTERAVDVALRALMRAYPCKP